MSEETAEQAIVRLTMDQFGHWWQRAVRMQGHVQIEEIVREAFETGAATATAVALAVASEGLKKVTGSAQ